MWSVDEETNLAGREGTVVNRGSRLTREALQRIDVQQRLSPKFTQINESNGELVNSASSWSLSSNRINVKFYF